jgi:hypothetical protein
VREPDELSEVTALGVAVGARGHRLFAGHLDRQELRWVERAAARVVATHQRGTSAITTRSGGGPGVASALTAGSGQLR